MRRLAALWLIPALLASAVFAATATPVRAASDGLTETGVTSYQLVPDKALIHVTITISLHNGKPNDVSTTKCGPYSTCTNTTRYYWNDTYVTVENEAGKITATSDGGAVSQAVQSSTSGYKTVKLTFPNVYYGQTRKVTAAYDIPSGKPRSKTDIRAGKAYANFCIGGQGRDSGQVTAVLPKGFAVTITGGDNLSRSSSGNSVVLSSGSIQSPYKFFSCLEATDDAALTSRPLTSGDQQFTIRAWPEDPKWATEVGGYVAGDFARLESMIGLKVPGNGAIEIREAANQELGAYDGFYDPELRMAEVSEDADPATVAHELSHIWFNGKLFKDKWMGEGFAGYAEQVAGAGNFQACTAPGKYPGTGNPDITTWPALDAKATQQQQDVLDYDYAAACWIVTDIADQIGAARLKDVFHAASGNEIAYAAPGAPAEKIATSEMPLDAQHLLDLFDERGLVPAGVKDLDLAQKLFAQYGVFSEQSLADRSKARAAYHALDAKTAGWKLPLAVRQPMADWQFSTAETAIATAGQILQLRDDVRGLFDGATLNGTTIQSEFEKAADQKSLDAVLDAVKKEAEAAQTVDAATHAYAAGRSPVQSLGLLGTNLQASLDEAKTAVVEARPDDATAAASKVMDALDGAQQQGAVRVVAAAATLVGLIALLLLLAFWRRRRRHAPELAPDGAAAAAPALAGSTGSGDWSAWSGAGARWSQAPAAGAPPPPPPAVEPPPPPAWPDADAATQAWTVPPPPPAEGNLDAPQGEPGAPTPPAPSTAPETAPADPEAAAPPPPPNTPATPAAGDENLK